MSDSEYPPLSAVHVSRAAHPRSPWRVLGIVLAVIACLAGLALLAAMILFAVALSNYGSNK